MADLGRGIIGDLMLNVNGLQTEVTQHSRYVLLFVEVIRRTVTNLILHFIYQVNFRGSTGYGKTFLHKGDGQWGVGDMQHDLTDAVNWAIEKGIADKNNICIFGGSYGGYACLAGEFDFLSVMVCSILLIVPMSTDHFCRFDIYS